MALALALAGCSSTSFSSLTTNILGGQPTGITGAAGVNDNAKADAADDVPCPDVTVRAGAATLMIGSKAGTDEPAALDVRYQGSILRTARECHVTAGIMSMKVGIEGRVITGPAGGPGTVDVPLRIAVVQEGVNPKTILSKFAREQVLVNNEIDRVTFAHVESDIAFPLPQPLGNISAYVVYVGFDPLGAAPQVKKKPAPKHRSKPSAKKPRPNIQPSQS